MKELKCPLCGKELVLQKLLTEVEDKYFCRAACPRCYWLTAIGRTSEKRSWQDAEEFISKFPPIIRVQKGDNLKLNFSDDIFTVIGRDINLCKLYLEDCFGNIEPVTPDKVGEWPWEIDQKGGDANNVPN